MDDTQLDRDERTIERLADEFFGRSSTFSATLEPWLMDWTPLPMARAERLAMYVTAAMACAGVVTWLLVVVLGDRVTVTPARIGRPATSAGANASPDPSARRSHQPWW